MQVEAAERRRIESENRGIKDPEKVKRMQQRAAKLEADESEAAKYGAMGNPALKVCTNLKTDAVINFLKQKFYFTVASRLKWHHRHRLLILFYMHIEPIICSLHSVILIIIQPNNRQLFSILFIKFQFFRYENHFLYGIFEAIKQWNSQCYQN